MIATCINVGIFLVALLHVWFGILEMFFGKNLWVLKFLD